ncbi:uncharacterized protein TA21215 [Theileria annulata]|uniref:Nin one binding (NOB1) Zn-ribbon like n=1 Tax=Theileria annulata TaxID=5874 RepID=Q4UGR4_THEAN|nr:uncharacterized protein TA21215 [Theileria annulata]CAI73725.1 hypothetical protein TA21215 [Theileria annulata]|eukprot:XP_954402.1 hypothetical protein TA21215 [Theileria annulata]
MDLNSPKNSTESHSADSENEKALVVDTGAYCRSTYLDKSGCKIYVTSGIKSEIEKYRQKNPLESSIRTVYTPIVREPSPEDVSFVRKFASLTGDLPFLSNNDIGCIALTRRLQIETGDLSPLREAPMTLKIDKQSNNSKNKSKKELNHIGFDCWIGTHNVNSYNIQVKKSIAKSVSCMTTDFAMQNVLIQMGLNVVTLDGFVAKSIRRWGQMCRSCYEVYPNTSRQFCSKCGNATVERVPITVDSETSEIIARDTRKWINTRGTIYTQPKPTTGRIDKPYITAEDQLLMPAFKNYMRNVNRKNKDDPLSHFYAEDTKENNISSSNQFTTFTNVTIGLGKGNPNSNRWVQRHKRSLKSK